MILNLRRRAGVRPLVAGLLATGVAVGLPACSADGGAGRPEVAAAVFPLAASVQALAGPDLHVVDLSPPGVEPHDLEVSAELVDAILDARVAVVMGRGFQPSVEAAAARRAGPTIEILDRLGAGDDPHVWLDPILMRRVVRLLAPALARDADLAFSAVSPRARRLEARLTALDGEYRAGLADCRRRVIVTAHDAFGRLARRYRLRSESIAGISPDQEPDPRRLAELADLVEREGVTTVFTERLVSPRVAQTLAREANVRTAVLDPMETAPAGSDIGAYFDAMRRNLRVLQAALGCSRP